MSAARLLKIIFYNRSIRISDELQQNAEDIEFVYLHSKIERKKLRCKQIFDSKYLPICLKVKTNNIFIMLNSIFIHFLLDITAVYLLTD